MHKLIELLYSSSTGTGRKIASNTIYQLVGKLVSMTITVAATIIVTRMYGREGYGEFNIMQNFPALFFIIVDFGFNAIATREISQHLEKAEKYLSNILVMRVLLSIVLMALCVGVLQFFPYNPNLKLGIYLSLILIMSQGLYACTNIIFQVKLRYDLSTIGYIVGSLVVLALVLLFSVLHLNIVWVSFSYVIGGLVTFGVNVLFMKSIGTHLTFDIDFSLWKYLIIQTLPLGLMFVFSQINFKADSILVSVMHLPASLRLTNTESVAVYGLAYKIFEVALVIPTFFMNAVYPVLVRHMLDGKLKLRGTFKKSIFVLFVFGLICSLGGVILAPFMINVLGGIEFTQSILALRLLCAGLFVFYLTQPISWLIVTLGKQKYLPLIYLVSAVFNVAANIVFIPSYSFYASAVITWVSELIILALLSLFALRAWKAKYA